MLIQPCLIVVDPVIVLAPDKVKIPEPSFIKEPSPDKFPENVELLPAFEVNVIPEGTEIFPAPDNDPTVSSLLSI